MRKPLLFDGITTVAQLQEHRLLNGAEYSRDEIDRMVADSTGLQTSVYDIFPFKPENEFPSGIPLDWEELPKMFSLDDLRTVHEQHRANLERKDSMIIDLPELARVRAQYSLLNLRENHTSDTVLVSGGGVPSVDSFKVFGFYLAAMGIQVVLVPGIGNQEVDLLDIDERTFAERMKMMDEQHGVFYPEGMLYAHILNELLKEGRIAGRVHLVGLSTGGPAAMRTAQVAFQHFSELGSRIATLNPMNSGGAYPAEVCADPSSRRRAAIQLAKGFMREMLSILPDMEQIIINTLDAGSQARSLKYLALQAQRCVSTVIQDVARDLPDDVDTTFICMDKSLGDRAIPYYQTQKAIDEAAALGRTISINTLNGNHGAPCSAAMQMAETIFMRALPDEVL